MERDMTEVYAPDNRGKAMVEIPPYWADPHMTEFNVSVSDCRKTDSGYTVIISEEVAKPAGGGQAGDRGKLIIEDKEVEFWDTVSHEGSPCLVTNDPVPAGTQGLLVIDMKWRESMMRNHTGEHIFVRALQNSLDGIELGTIWIDGTHGTVEVAAQGLEAKHLFRAEERVQRIISDALLVESSIIPADELDESVRAREGVASKHEKLRVVKIDGFDSSACSGIHVQNTRDLMAFKIVDYTIAEGRASIEFQTGYEALTRVSKVYNAVLQRKREYPFEMEQIGSVLDKAKSTREVHGEIVATLVSALELGPQYIMVGDATLRTEYIPGVEIGALRDLAKKAIMPNRSLLLLFTTGEQPSLGKCNVILRTHDTPEAAANYIAEIVEELGGRGGGSQDIYTGGFSSCGEPETLFQRVVERLRERLS